MSEYKPTEHDGLRQDGQPNKRVGTGQFAQGKVDPHEASKQGGKSSGGGVGSSSDSSDDNYKPTENNKLTKDGNRDGRVKDN